MKKWNIILIGGGSLQVQEILDRFEERQLPVEKIRLLDERTHCGELHDFKGEPYLVGRLEDIPEEGFDVAVLLSPIKELDSIVNLLGEGGIALLDLSGSITPSARIPVLFSEYSEPGRQLPEISVLPSPMTLAAGLICKPIHQRFGIKSILVSGIQSVSESGSQKGMDELFDQVRSILNFKDLESNEFRKQIAFNLFPVSNMAESERRAAGELGAFLGIPGLEFKMDVHWVGAFVGIIGSLWIGTREKVDPETLLALLKEAPSVKYIEERDEYGLLDAVGGDDVLAAGLRTMDEDPCNLTLRFAIDNLRKGLSTNLTQILESFTRRKK